MAKRKRKTSARSAPDKVEKLLEDYADVFADIINVLVFDGEEVVKQENLRDGPAASIFKAAEGNYRQKDRDVMKYDTQNGIAFTVYGLENQTKTNRLMPMRVMGYDYAAYEKNAREIKAQNKAEGHEADFAEEIWPDQKLMPVITLVLYFGMEEWDGGKSLYDLIDIPERLMPFIPNYPINLVQVAFLPDETIAKFKSDFRVVAEFFRAKRLGKEKELLYNSSKKWDHVPEIMDFLQTFTSDKRYGEIKEIMVQESRKGEVKMCTLMDALLKEGEVKGEAKGEKKGYIKGRFEALEGLASKGLVSLEEAMEALDFSEEERSGYKKWIADNKQS